MKKHLAFAFLFSSALSAFAADPAATTTNSASTPAGTPAATGTANSAAMSGTASTTGTAANASPAATCKTIVENAKNKDYAAVMKSSTDVPMNKKASKKEQAEFNKMSGKYFEHMSDLNCGNEMVTKDRAVVEAESKGEKRLIPFVMTKDGWKFDFKTYQSFYDTNQKHHKSM